VNSINGGMSLAVASTTGESITKTYTFNQTISTSDDPDFVGSEGDLYIGNTKNYYYGSYDNVQSSAKPLGDGPSQILTNSSGESIHISKQKAFYFAEEPSETFFIFSQKYIVETLIPELEGFILGIDLGNIAEETPGVLTKAQYQEQIRLWKNVIQDNEQTKYLSLYEREQYKAAIKENLEREIAALNSHLDAIEKIGETAIAPGLFQIGVQSIVEAKALLNTKKESVEKKLALLESEFVNNVSFDAGVGEYTKSSEMTIVQQKTKSVNINFDASLETTFGFELRGTGVLLHNNASANG